MAVHDLVVKDPFRVELVTELVSQIGGRMILCRIGSIALAERPVALLTVGREERLSLLNVAGGRSERALLSFPAFWNRPPRVLRRRHTRKHADDTCHQRWRNSRSWIPHARYYSGAATSARDLRARPFGNGLF